jgi:ribosomal protein L29
MKEKKNLSEKEIGKKVIDLKIELLKQPQKRKRIKKEIARLLTMKTKSGGNK